VSLRLRVAAVLLTLACVGWTVAWAARRHLPPGDAAPLLVVGSLFVLSGVVASTRRPGNVTGGLLALTAAVRIGREGHRLAVEVTDDGVGGASVRAGSGLEGLGDRVAALDGRLGIESPAGRGTRVWAELPCG